MKTILYNPIFINPQAYYVFPRLTRYLQPDNESTSEPANYIGTIEVKVIAYGDTTLKRTYTNTDSIDLSEFKNTWIRISLFTKVGSCVLGEWKIGNMESDLPYIDPEVLASLKAVVIVGNKTNNDSDRAIVKNLVDASNPFVISNASFKLNSGFGKYEVDFTSWIQTNGVIASSDKVQNSIIGRFLYFNTVNKKEDVPSFKVNITLGQQGKLQYNYIKEDGTSTYIVYSESGIYTIPSSYFSKYTGGNAWFGFYQIEGTSIIEQIPSFEGAFVTDGINDLITSTKTVQEMLGGSNEITVVSMMANLDSRQILCNSNFSNTNGYNVRNTLEPNGVISMLGYTDKNGTTNNLNLIMGDKDSIKLVDKVNFNSDYVFYPAQYYKTYYQVAWYWTIIANKVLTTDQINQVIAYFNLDRTLKPDILCDIEKQGITNENHAEFGDKLIDFSGNGRDIQLNNIAWKGDSGIGKYEVDFLDSSIWNSSNSTITSSKIDCKNAISHIMLLYYSIGSKEYPDIPSFKVIKTGADIDYSYIDETGAPKSVKIVDGVNILPASHNTLYSGSSRFCGFGNPGMGNSVTITQIPSHAGGLCLDGINDFGKVTGMPVYKDYTFIIDRQIISIGNIFGIVASKSESATDTTKQGAFLFEYLGAPNNISTWSFYNDNHKVGETDFTKSISYQSKYSYNGKELTVGEAKDSDKLWLGTLRDKDSRFANVAIYSLMSFPYSMSKFLIERQLKKHKLGTLYPDMVELRPIIKANAEHGRISYYNASWNPINVGDYLEVGARVNIVIDRLNIEKITEIKVSNAEYVGYNFDEELNHWNVLINLTSKSPQKINITIDEYIRFEDIVQPYPLFFEFTDENGNLISWGGKAKVGSTITRTKGVNYANLLEGLFTITNPRLNGVPLSSSQHVVEKSMVFTCTATWTFDNNEPKSILSPRLLSIPNSSYKILGYIPDISGHGNNGKINNSAYAGMSGANGYPYDYKNGFMAYSNCRLVDSEIFNVISISPTVNIIKNTPTYKGKIKVTGLSGYLKLRIYPKDDSTNAIEILEDGVYDINIDNETGNVYFHVAKTKEGSNDINVIIQQVGEYEGAYCLDGVDDFVTIPTTIGGKQMLMKVNWDDTLADAILYDQRGYPNEFAIYNSDNDNSGNPVFAYQARNNGQTYIDGILNNNIKSSELIAITHNITITNELNSGANNNYPLIGSNRVHDAFFTKMSLYDFMLFDNISTDDKILELNEYVGIEGNTE